VDIGRCEIRSDRVCNWRPLVPTKVLPGQEREAAEDGQPQSPGKLAANEHGGPRRGEQESGGQPRLGVRERVEDESENVAQRFGEGVTHGNLSLAVLTANAGRGGN